MYTATRISKRCTKIIMNGAFLFILAPVHQYEYVHCTPYIKMDILFILLILDFLQGICSSASCRCGVLSLLQIEELIGKIRRANILQWKLYRITSTTVLTNNASRNKVQLPCHSPTIICILDVNDLSWVALNPKAEIVLLVSILLLIKSAKNSPEVSQMRRPTALEGLKTMDILNILHTCTFDLVPSVGHVQRWIRNWWACGF